MIHSTRGKAPSSDVEFWGTLEWFASVKSQVSAHVVIARDGRLASCVDASVIAWHARSPANETMLGAELVQAWPGDPIADRQLATLAWWLRLMSRRFGFELVEVNLPEHKDLPARILDGKTDVGPDYSFGRLARFLEVA